MCVAWHARLDLSCNSLDDFRLSRPFFPLLIFPLPPAAKNPPKLTGPADDAADIGDVHVVLPRRKAGELDAPEREAVVVTPEILSSLFHHPLAVASQKLVSSLRTTRLAGGCEYRCYFALPLLCPRAEEKIDASPHFSPQDVCEESRVKDKPCSSRLSQKIPPSRIEPQVLILPPDFCRA
jgi:hypothetical protein